MSVSIVSDNHINALVHSLETFSKDTPFTNNTGLLDAIAQMLLNENYRSFYYRSPSDAAKSSRIARRIDYTPPTTSYSPVEILKACDCYEAQLHESDYYLETPAGQWIKKIRAAATSALPGYAEASWVIA